MAKRETQILWEEPGKVQGRGHSVSKDEWRLNGDTSCWDNTGGIFQGIMRAQERTCRVYDAREHYWGEGVFCHPGCFSFLTCDQLKDGFWESIILKPLTCLTLFGVPSFLEDGLKTKKQKPRGSLPNDHMESCIRTWLWKPFIQRAWSEPWLGGSINWSPGWVAQLVGAPKSGWFRAHT